MARKYAHRIPFMVKLNHNEFLSYPNRYDQIMFGSVRQAFEMGCRGGGGHRLLRVGGVHPADPGGLGGLRGSPQPGGLVTVLWCYTRNAAFKTADKDYHTSADLTGQANHLGVTIGADIIKQKMADTNGGYTALKFGKTHPKVYSELTPRRPPHRVGPLPVGQLPTWVGRGLINSGGGQRGNDLVDAVRTAVINKRAGGMGLISGRKAFPAPHVRGSEDLLNGHPRTSTLTPRWTSPDPFGDRGSGTSLPAPPGGRPLHSFRRMGSGDAGACLPSPTPWCVGAPPSLRLRKRDGSRGLPEVIVRLRRSITSISASGSCEPGEDHHGDPLPSTRFPPDVRQHLPPALPGKPQIQHHQVDGVGAMEELQRLEAVRPGPGAPDDPGSPGAALPDDAGGGIVAHHEGADGIGSVLGTDVDRLSGGFRGKGRIPSPSLSAPPPGPRGGLFRQPPRPPKGRRPPPQPPAPAPRPAPPRPPHPPRTRSSSWRVVIPSRTRSAPASRRDRIPPCPGPLLQQVAMGPVGETTQHPRSPGS